MSYFSLPTGVRFLRYIIFPTSKFLKEVITGVIITTFEQNGNLIVFWTSKTLFGVFEFSIKL